MLLFRNNLGWAAIRRRQTVVEEGQIIFNTPEGGAAIKVSNVLFKGNFGAGLKVTQIPLA